MTSSTSVLRERSACRSFSVRRGFAPFIRVTTGSRATETIRYGWGALPPGSGRASERACRKKSPCPSWTMSKGPRTIILVLVLLRSHLFPKHFLVDTREHEHCEEQQYCADPLADVEAEVGACGLIAGDEIRVYKYRGERKAELGDGRNRSFGKLETVVVEEEREDARSERYDKEKEYVDACDNAGSGKCALRCIEDDEKNKPDHKAQRSERLECSRAQYVFTEDSRGAPERSGGERECRADEIGIKGFTRVELRYEIGEAHEIRGAERDNRPQPEILVHALAEHPPRERDGDKRLDFLKHDGNRRIDVVEGLGESDRRERRTADTDKEN